MLRDFLDELVSHVLRVELAEEHEGDGGTGPAALVLHLLVHLEPGDKPLGVLELQPEVVGLAQPDRPTHQLEEVTAGRAPLQIELKLGIQRAYLHRERTASGFLASERGHLLPHRKHLEAFACASGCSAHAAGADSSPSETNNLIILENIFETLDITLYPLLFTFTIRTHAPNLTFSPGKLVNNADSFLRLPQFCIYTPSTRLPSFLTDQLG